METLGQARAHQRDGLVVRQRAAVEPRPFQRLENLPSEQVSVLSEDPGTVQKHLRIEAVQDLPHVKYDVSNHTTLSGASQNSRLPSAMHLPPLRSKSMTLSPEMLKRIFSPILKIVLPKTTPVSRKSPTRTLIVDSMPVRMAP